MRVITIVAIGKLKESYLRGAQQEYLKRLMPYVKVKVVELPATSFSDSTKVKARKEETLRLKKYVESQSESTIIVLDQKGKQYISENFAGFVTKGTNPLVFVIGGPLGFDDDFLPSATRLSMSSMTFTHDMARVILLEQLYRAATIYTGKQYHY